MAKATTKSQQITTKSYVLELSEDEAHALAAVLTKVGGSQEDSPRKHTEAVHRALDAQGVSGFSDGSTWGSPFRQHVADLREHPAKLASGSLQFANYPLGSAKRG
jgi:hypothetical protein